MDFETLKCRLENEGEAFIKDDFIEAAIRLEYTGTKTLYYIKHYKSKEVSIHSSNKTAFDIILGGEEITKEEYRRL